MFNSPDFKITNILLIGLLLIEGIYNKVMGLNSVGRYLQWLGLTLRMMNHGLSSRTSYWRTELGVDYGFRDVMSLRNWELIFSKWAMPAYEHNIGGIEGVPPVQDP